MIHQEKAKKHMESKVSDVNAFKMRPRQAKGSTKDLPHESLRDGATTTKSTFKCKSKNDLQTEGGFAFITPHKEEEVSDGWKFSFQISNTYSSQSRSNLRESRDTSILDEGQRALSPPAVPQKACREARFQQSVRKSGHKRQLTQLK